MTDINVDLHPTEWIEFQPTAMKAKLRFTLEPRNRIASTFWRFIKCRLSVKIEYIYMWEERA